MSLRAAFLASLCCLLTCVPIYLTFGWLLPDGHTVENTLALVLLELSILGVVSGATEADNSVA